MKLKTRDCGQDGGVGRHTVPPHTAKRRTTTNLKTKNNQNWQKIELYGSPTTKELKKKHSSRRVGGAETGSWGREDPLQGGGWRTQRGGRLWNGAGQAAASRPRKVVAGRPCGPHSHVDRPGGTSAEWSRPRNPRLQRREIKPQTSDWKHPWGFRRQREKLSVSQESSLESPTGA